MDLSMDVDIHGSYLSNTSTWMWSVLSMDIQLDIHPLPSLPPKEAWMFLNSIHRSPPTVLTFLGLSLSLFPPSTQFLSEYGSWHIFLPNLPQSAREDGIQFIVVSKEIRS
jgi:hypothetical protein